METQNIVGIEELRNNLEKYISRVRKGATLIVVKNTKPVFKIVPIDDGSQWELVADFTRIQKGGVLASDLLEPLTNGF